VVIGLEERGLSFSRVIRVRIEVQVLAELGLVLVIVLVCAHHAIFIVFAFDFKLAAAFLLLHLKALFRVVVDKALHPVDYSLLVELNEPVERDEYVGGVLFEIKVKIRHHLSTCGLYLFVADLCDYWRDNYYGTVNDRGKYTSFLEIFTVVGARFLRFFLLELIFVLTKQFIGNQLG